MKKQNTVDICKNGINQSPIHLETKIAKTCNTKCTLLFYYRSSRCNLVRSNRFFYIDYDKGSHIVYNGEVYELEKISFTSPASHKIDNTTGTIEAHLYHRSPTSEQTLIIAVLYEVNEASSKSKIFFDNFINFIPNTDKSITINMSSDWDAFYMIPVQKSFFTYSGSLVNYPCSENVTWIVFSNFANVSDMTYRKITGIIGNNARNIQPIRHRDIFYNSNMSSRNGINQANPILCMTDKELKKHCLGMIKDQKKNTRMYGDAKILISLLVIITFLFILTIVVFIKFGVFDKLIASFNDAISQPIELPSKITK
jgi:carbonic anhydrase